MCLRNRLSKKELEAFKKTLPEVFPVWKIVCWDNRSEFSDGDEREQTLNKKGVYFARNCRGKRRMEISYKPGFHAFLSYEEAELYAGCGTIIEFQAKRSWIKVVGKIRNTDIQSVVLSKIEVI